MLIGFFIDDSKILEIPPQLSDLNIKWHIFRSYREYVKSKIFLEVKADYILFDYYLGAGATGTDVLLETQHHYSEMGWDLPSAHFISSDPSCNELMRNIWVNKFDGKTLSDSVVKKEKFVNNKVIDIRSHFRKNKNAKINRKQ